MQKEKNDLFFFICHSNTLNYGVLCVYGLNSFSLFAVSKVWQHIYIYLHLLYYRKSLAFKFDCQDFKGRNYFTYIYSM